MKKILLFVILLTQAELTSAQSKTFHKIDLTTFTMHRKGDTLCFVHPVTVDGVKCSECFGTRNQIIYTKFVIDSTGLNNNEFCKRLYVLPNYFLDNPNGIPTEVTVPYTSQLGAFGTEITTTPGAIYYKKAAVMKQMPKITTTKAWCFHIQFLLIGLFLIAFFSTWRKEWNDDGDKTNALVPILMSAISVIIVPLLLFFFWLCNDFMYHSEPKIWLAFLVINLVTNCITVVLFSSGLIWKRGRTELSPRQRNLIGIWNMIVSYLFLLGVYYGFMMDVTKVFSVVIISLKILVAGLIVRFAIKWVPIIHAGIKQRISGPNVAVEK